MRVARILGYALLVVLTGLIVVRWAGLDRWGPLVQAMIVVPYLTAVCLLVMIVLFAIGRRKLAIWALVVLVGYFAALLPRWAVNPPDTPQGFTLRVMTVNLHEGKADAKDLVSRIADRRPDLLAVQELTPDEASALASAGIGRYLPRSVLRPGAKETGSGIYSRGALSDGGVVSPDTSYPMARATMAVGDSALDVVSVHTRPPLWGHSTADWFRDLDLLPPTTADGTQLLLGDFNATNDQHGFRNLTHGGYRDAAASIGAGLKPTWHRWPVPPVTVDHVLTEHRMTATAAHTYGLRGADHQILETDLVLTNH